MFKAIGKPKSNENEYKNIVYMFNEEEDNFVTELKRGKVRKSENYLLSALIVVGLENSLQNAHMKKIEIVKVKRFHIIKNEEVGINKTESWKKRNFIGKRQVCTLRRIMFQRKKQQ